MAKIMLGESFPVLIADVVGWRLTLAEQLGGKPIHLTQSTLAEGAACHGLPRVDGAFDTSGKEIARRVRICWTNVARLSALGMAKGFR